VRGSMGIWYFDTDKKIKVPSTAFANPGTCYGCAKKVASFSEHPSEKAYDEDATYKEDGKGKFPIRPGNPKDAIDALRLEHHAPADEQPKVHEKACKELKKDDKEAYERNCT